jgi:hypothetical protein
LNEIPNLVNDPKVHEDFRLVLNCQTTSYLSWLLLVRSKATQIESFPSFRHTLGEIFHHFGAVMHNFETQPANERLMYLLALVRSQLLFRDFIRPFGFNTSSEISFWQFNPLSSVIRQTTETAGIPIRNLAEMAEDVFGAGLTEINCELFFFLFCQVIVWMILSVHSKDITVKQSDGCHRGDTSAAVYPVL